MINDEIQNQQSGDNSFNCQAGGNITIINNGITQENVKQIFMEMFKANMPKLREIAKEELPLFKDIMQIDFFMQRFNSQK